MASVNNNVKALFSDEIDLTSATGAKFTWIPLHPMKVYYAGFVTTAARSGTITTEGVVKLVYTPSGGAGADQAVWTSSSTNLNTLGREYNPDSSSALLTTPLTVQAGDKLEWKVTTQMAGTSPVNKGKVVIYYDMIPDGQV
jgi:hypothetical protein